VARAVVLCGPEIGSRAGVVEVFQDPEYILKEIRNAFKGEDKCS
jgi:hypothetical protein